MKTLKLALVAAMAIGFISVSQAVGALEYPGSTSFEGFDVGDSVDSTLDSLFLFTGAQNEDNESEIVEGTVTASSYPRVWVNEEHTKHLKVSTGHDPLFRKIQSEPVDLVGESAPSQIYIDTLMQFTVTSAKDEVTGDGVNDKLLVYLKEMTNSVGTVSSTNLVVRAASFTPGTAEPETPDVLEEREVTVSSSVEPGTWYRLTIKSYVTDGLLVFNIWLDGTQLTTPTPLLGSDGTAFPSLLGKAETTIEAIGFAGEAVVDDIAFSTADALATALDFTLALGANVSSVSFTIDGVEFSSSAASTTYKVFENSAIVLGTPTFAAGYMMGGVTLSNLRLVDGAYITYDLNPSLSITAEQFFPRTETAGQDGTADHPYEVADAAAIMALHKGMLLGVDGANASCYVQTANIDMTGVNGFYGIGWYSSSSSYASLPPGITNPKTSLPFTGTYDGNGKKISNVTIVRHSYAGVFNSLEGTVKNLTVENIDFSGTCDEWGCAIVGNAQGSALLENLTSMGSTWGDEANHNVAGIAVRAQNSVTIRGCVNNAPITSKSRRLGGILSFAASTNPKGTITIDGCTNNAALTTINATLSEGTPGDRGVGGIISRPESKADGLLLKNCANFGVLSNSVTPDKVGQFAGELTQNYVDGGGNTFLASTNMVGNYNGKTITGLAYATASTIGGYDYLTTVKATDIEAGGTYVLLVDIPASADPVITLTNANDTIAFDTAKGYAFAGEVAPGEGLQITSNLVGTVTTYTASQLPPSPTVVVDADGTNVLGEVTAEDVANITAWAAANSIELNGVIGEQAAVSYLLGADELMTYTDVDDILEIKSINQTDGGTWQITLGTADGVMPAINFTKIRGRLQIIGADTLPELGSAAPVTAAKSSTVTVNNQFIKAQIVK